MFFRFENRLTITGRLVAETALRIGGGKDTEVAAPDLPVVRDGSGAPFIPGSSLKGVVRSYMESLVRGVSDSVACDPTNREKTCISREQFKELQQKYQKDEQQLALAVQDSSCLICSVFGSTVMSSHIAFSDAAAHDWYGQFQVRNGVAINRDSGKAEDRALYDFEVVPSGTGFAFKVVLENGNDWMRGMVAAAINLVKAGSLTVGGSRSRGLGSVSLRDLKFEFISSPTQLIEFLEDPQSTLAGPWVEDDVIKEWVAAFREKLKESANVQTAGK
jgi:CRISPR-associated RAMP protein (TIGR02581 family)